MPVTDAIILAAGLGMRLRSVIDAQPKGLIEINGETLVGRSVRLLRGAGIARITIVAGYCADQYRRFAEGQPGIDVLINDGFATTGSMASLAMALDHVPRDMLVLESDLIYEPRALTPMLHSPAPDATLLSGPTGAGDEVWVCAPDGRVQAMSKTAASLAAVTGEFVGITRLSAGAAGAMRRAFSRFVEANGHGRMDYETGALVEIAGARPILATLVHDLLWGELDDERHLRRILHIAWPSNGRSNP